MKLKVKAMNFEAELEALDFRVCACGCLMKSSNNHLNYSHNESIHHITDLQIKKHTKELKVEMNFLCPTLQQFMFFLIKF